MNIALAIDPAVRAQRYSATEFAAFKVSEPMKHAWNPAIPEQTTYALGTVEAETVEEARAKALAQFALSHKQQLIIREAGPRGVLLHIFAIVRKPDVWVYDRNHIPQRRQRLDTKPLCIVDAGVIGATGFGE